MPTIVFNTRDVGLAIRDHLEQKRITRFVERDMELVEAEQDEVVAVDVSDAHNPIVCLDNGQTFNVRIFAGEAPSGFKYSLCLAAKIGAWMPPRIGKLAKHYETRAEADAAGQLAKKHPSVDTYEIHEVEVTTPTPKTITALDVFQINDIAAELIDELCRKVQQKMGVTDGGFASHWFSGEEYSIDMAQIVGEYAEAEFKHHQNSDDVKEGGS